MTNKNYFQISTGEKNFEKVVSATRGNVYICSIVEAALKRTEDFGRVPVHGISWNTAVIPIPRIELANKELVICAIQIKTVWSACFWWVSICHILETRDLINC